MLVIGLVMLVIGLVMLVIGLVIGGSRFDVPDNHKLFVIVRFLVIGGLDALRSKINIFCDFL